MTNTVAPSDVAPWSLSNRLRETRERLGLTQLQVARRARLTRHRYSDIERGHVLATPSEMERLAAALETSRRALIRNTDWRPAQSHSHRRRSSLRERCTWRPERKVPIGAYITVALGRYRSFVTAFLGLIAKRKDLARVRHFLRDVACNSDLEAVTILGLLALGAIPIWESPLRVGFRKWPVLLRGRQAGDCRHPGLELQFRGVRIVFLFQVTVQVRQGPKFRLDALVVARARGGRNRFFVAEVDGPLHVPEKDGERAQFHELPEVRVEWPLFRQERSPALVLLERIVERVGVEFSEEGTTRRVAAGEEKRTRQHPEATPAPTSGLGRS